MIQRLSRILGGIAFTFFVAAITTKVQASILPPNDLHLEDNLAKDANINEELFNKIIDDIMAVYEPIIQSHGASLTTNKRWGDSTVNASAQQFGTTWIVNMYGGLARRDEITPDGFALVVCHELGHHLAGFAFYGRSDWAASEGQSDYFATQACARKVWGSDHELNATFRDTVHPTAKSKCDSAWQSTQDQNLCYRTAMAGYSLASLLAALRGATVDFDNPDTREAPRTVTSHPPGQCRLDTYTAGAICTTSFDSSIIPARNHPEGQTSEAAEIIASRYACTRAAFQSEGVRPRCWYKPQIENLLVAHEMSQTEIQGNGNGAFEPGETLSMLLSLGNLATRSYENVYATIKPSADQSFSIIRGEVHFPEVNPNASSSPTEPFEIQLANHLQCGVKVPVSVSLEIGRGGSQTQITRNVQIGRLENSETTSLAPGTAIPDAEPEGIEDVTEISLPGVYADVRVSVDITHTYRGDLSVNLISPAGKLFEIHRRSGGAENNVNKTMDFALEGAEISGEWKMHVIDHAGADTGTLDRWSLTFVKAICE